MKIAAFSLSLCLAAAASSAAPTTARAQIDHLSIAVANVQTSASFYKGAFGLTELPNPFAGGGGVVWLDLGNGMALHIFGGRGVPTTDTRERHLAITVTDIARVTTYLTSQRLDWQDFEGVAGKMQTRPDGVHQLFFRDPDGYWVEVNDALSTLKR